MAVNFDITNILNQWADMGVFSYVVPFVLIFAVVYAILQRTGIFAPGANSKGVGGTHNNAVEGIIAGSVALLSLQFDFVSTFFATIFPRFGIGLAILLVGVLTLAFVDASYSWVGWVVAIGAIIWAWTSWDDWMGSGGLFGSGDFFMEYLPQLIVLGALVAIILVTTKKKDKDKEHE